MTEAAKKPGLQAFGALLVALALTAGIHLLPSPWGRTIAWPLLLFSTYAHEMSHGLAALVVGGHFESFQMWLDASGVAQTAIPTGNGVAQAIVSAGGLIGPALYAAILFGLGCRGRLARAGLLGLGLALLLSDALVVRNAFGLVYVGAAGVLLVACARIASASQAQAVALFLAVQLALTVFTRADYLFTQVAHTSGGDMPSDVQNMATALGAPFWVWGALCGGFSVAVLLVGMWLFVRTNTPREAQST